MQRDKDHDGRSTAAGSGREPPVIEGEFVRSPADEDAAGAQAAAPAPSEDIEPKVDALPDAETSDAIDAIASPPPRRRGLGGWLAAIVALVVVVAGAVAWLAAPTHRLAADMRARVVALLPASAQHMLGVSPAQSPAPASERSDAASPVPSAPSAEKPSVAGANDAPAASAPANSAANESPSQQEKTASPPAASQEKSATAASQAPASGAPSESRGSDAGAAAPSNEPATVSSAAQAAPSSQDKDVSAAPAVATPTPTASAAPAAAVDAPGLASIATRLGALEAKLDAVVSSSAALDAASRQIEALSQRIGALEKKLEPPKSDVRASQARENAAPSGREFAASRAVVAQAASDALRNGAPLGDDVAALRALGVGDDKLSDLGPYLKAGAPTVAQLQAQWRGLRARIVAADGPPPGADFTDKLLAKAKGVFRITWAGHSTAPTATAIFGRVDAALQRGDLATALSAADELPAAAKAAAADWQAAAVQRAKADSAARALLSDSIAAIGRPPSQ